MVSFVVAMNRVDVVDLVVDLVDVDLDVELVDVDRDDQKYDCCLSWTDLNIVDGLNRQTCIILKIHKSGILSSCAFRQAYTPARKSRSFKSRLPLKVDRDCTSKSALKSRLPLRVDHLETKDLIISRAPKSI